MISNKSAQILGTVIVLLAVAVLGGTAVYLSSNAGNQVSGFTTALDADCYENITTAGNYILSNDLLNCPHNGIKINHSDVTLDCNGHTISYGGSDMDAGVFIFSPEILENVVVKNCKIEGFNYGIDFGFALLAFIEINNSQAIGNEISATE